MVLVSYLTDVLKACACANVDTEGMYANFAGRDASRGMAKQSFDEGMMPVCNPSRRPMS